MSDELKKLRGYIREIEQKKPEGKEPYFRISLVGESGAQMYGITRDDVCAYPGNQLVDVLVSISTYQNKKTGADTPSNWFYLPNHVKSTKSYQPSQPQASRLIHNQQPQAGTVPADLITKIHALTKKVDELEKQIIELQTGQRPQGAVQTVLPPDHEEQGEPDPTIPF